MELEEFGLGGLEKWASIVLLRIFDDLPEKETSRLRGFIFIIERGHEDPAWKMPGGQKKNGDATPLITAWRELPEETGVALELERFSYAGKELGAQGRSWEHWRCIFTADGCEKDVKWMNSLHPGNEGEEPRYFPLEEAKRLFRGELEYPFLPGHFILLTDFALIL